MTVMSLPLPHLDLMPVREALRVLRHGLQRGRRGLRETIPLGDLPEPAARIASTVLNGLDSLAEEVAEATTDVTRRLLSEGRQPVPGLRDFAADPNPEAAFSKAMYAALRAILSRMGDRDAFVSEALIRQAYAQATAAEPGLWQDRPADAAGDMMLRLLAAHVVRDVSPELQARLGQPSAAPVAVFAALLWLMTDRSDEDSEDALAAAADLSEALAAEITAGAAGGDRARLGALFTQFASHV